MVTNKRLNRSIAALTIALALSLATVRDAPAAVIFAWSVNPTTTAGGGATSTRSGIGTWQLYALDTDASSFGISSYNISMDNTTAINHRAPVTTINDQNGDPQTAGFNLLRTATNANPIQASQNLPGQTPFLITGFGQTAGNFTSKAQAIDPGSMVVVPTTSGSWGTYNDPRLSPSIYSLNRSWVFLAEGAYNASGPWPRVGAAVATIFSNQAGVSVAAQVILVPMDFPEPGALSLVALALVGGGGSPADAMDCGPDLIDPSTACQHLGGVG